MGCTSCPLPCTFPSCIVVTENELLKLNEPGVITTVVLAGDEAIASAVDSTFDSEDALDPLKSGSVTVYDDPKDRKACSSSSGPGSGTDAGSVS